MKLNNLKGSLILITAALIWGLAFVAQSGAADLVPPFLFNALRSFIGMAALLLFRAFIGRKEKEPFFPNEREGKKQYLAAALVCGICLSVSINFQQFGIALYPKGAASEARAGFITALYVVLVPLFSVFMRKKVHILVWIAVLISMSGFYLLCFSEGISGIYIADILVFICAITFSFHIMAVDKYVGITGGIKLSVLQFAVAGIISLGLSLVFETSEFNLSNILAASPQILYLGIMSSGVAYTLQIIGQKYAEPAICSLSMSLESVFAALGGWLISGNSLKPMEFFGCGLVFVGIIVAQLPQFSKKA